MDSDKLADDAYPLKSIDLSAEERAIARSKNIRKGILDFMQRNVGQVFEGDDLCSPWDDLRGQAANWVIDKHGIADCASETAGRWMKQFSRPGQPYLITHQAAGMVIMKRPSHPR